MADVFGIFWPWFRRLPSWAQWPLAFGVALFVSVIATAPFNGADDEPWLVSAGTTTSTPSTTIPLPTSTTTTPPAGLPTAGDDTTVTRVIDGDTIEVATSPGTRVRLIGIDAPESTTVVGCYGNEATDRARALLPTGTKVRLTHDAERVDRFGRTLAYVYRLADGLFVNFALAQDGYAQQLTIPPNVAHADEFARAVAEARDGNRGLWAACATTTSVPPPTAPPTAARITTTVTAPRPTTSTTEAPASGCHSSYAGACVPVASDVDCGGGPGNGPAYVYEKNFQVVGPDVYDLDRNNDGIACESR